MTSGASLYADADHTRGSVELRRMIEPISGSIERRSGRGAAVDRQTLAGNERGVVGYQIENRPGVVCRQTQSLQGNVCYCPPAFLVPIRH